MKEIIKVLGLNGDENNDEIINDLIENGRQSLGNYENKITSEIYDEQMNGNNTELIKLLKKYFQLKWKTQYIASNPWFISFLERYQNGENSERYEHILTRTAHYGNKYMKNCPILSIVLQLLFEDIDDKCLEDTNVFNELWFTIANSGLQSIRKYSEYIIPDIMDEQINKNSPILFQALRQYYRQRLFLLLEQSDITDKQNLYDFALDNVAEYGWKDGIKAIEKKILARRFKTLLENMPGNFDSKQKESERQLYENYNRKALLQ